MPDRLKNYFLGTNIIEDYEDIRKKHPEKINQLNSERNRYIILGKAIPNAIDLGGIVLAAVTKNPLGALPILAGEIMRFAINERYSLTKIVQDMQRIERIMD